MHEESLIDERGPGRGPDLATLSERHRDRLVARARRVLDDANEAEDVAQEALLRAASSRPDDAAAVARWLERVVQRLALDRLRERIRRRAADEQASRAKRTIAVLDEERAAELRAALARLREPYRTAVRARYLDGQDFAEIAARMGTIERTARTWTGRGLQQLRDRLAR